MPPRTVDWEPNKDLPLGKGATVQQFFATVGKDQFEINVAPWGEETQEIMQYGVTTVSPDESVNRVMNLMTHHRVRHMPVLRGGKLAGIVSIGDVVKHRLEDLELETNVLRDVYNAAR
jgi:CBS domain-containing protein